MDTLKPLITNNEFTAIFAKSKLSESDVYKLSSVTPYTLVEKLGELKREELNEVYLLETKNLYAILNTVSILLGLSPYANRLIENAINTPFVQRVLAGCDQADTSVMSTEALKYLMLSRFILSGCDPQAKFEPKFEGKIPTKIFSFRQMSADEWYRDFTNIVLSRTFIIWDKGGDAFVYLIRNICYYLNKSQTFKYYKKSSDKDDNDMFYRMANEFLNAVDGKAVIKTTLMTKLHKDL